MNPIVYLAQCLLTLQKEIEQAGNDQNSLHLKDEYIRLRNLLMEIYGLPKVTEYFNLLIPKPQSDKEAALDDSITPQEMLEWTARGICTRLYRRSREDDLSPILSLEEILYVGRDEGLPVEDILTLLHYDHTEFNRFLIETVWFLGYGSEGEVLRDLQKAQEPLNRWLFSLYRSDKPEERELGLSQLKKARMTFIEQFLAMDRMLEELQDGTSAQSNAVPIERSKMLKKGDHQCPDS